MPTKLLRSQTGMGGNSPAALLWRVASGFLLLIGLSPLIIQFTSPVNAQNPSALSLPTTLIIKADGITQSSFTIKVTNAPDNYNPQLYDRIRIFVFKTGDTVSTATADLPLVTQATFKNLSAGTQYWVLARMYDDILDVIASSKRLYVTTLGSSAPDTPTGLKTSGITTSGITLAWTASTGGAVTRYEVSTDGSSWTDSGSDTTHSFSGLTANTQYTLRVRAVGPGGTSTAASVTASTNQVAPDTPTGLKTSGITTSGITLAWTASTGGAVTRYEVSTDGSSWTDSGSDTTHSFSGLTANTQYTLRVRAVGPGGTSTAASVTASTNAGKPGQPTGFKASNVTHDSVKLIWTAPSSGGSVTHYEIRQSSVSSWTTVSGATSYTFSNLKANTLYIFYLRSVGPGGVSNRTFAFTRTTADTSTAPNTPTGLIASVVTQTSITLGWTASTGGAVTRYEVSTDGTNWTDSGSDTTHSFSGLTANTQYTLRVRAVGPGGTSTAASTTATTTASVGSLPGERLGNNNPGQDDDFGQGMIRTRMWRTPSSQEAIRSRVVERTPMSLTVVSFAPGKTERRSTWRSTP